MNPIFPKNIAAVGDVVPYLPEPLQVYNEHGSNPSLIGDAVGETEGYPIGLVVKIDRATNTCTPLASVPGVNDAIGILLDNIEGLAAAATSTQPVTVLFRNSEYYSSGLKLRAGVALADVEKSLFKQDCAALK